MIILKLGNEEKKPVKKLTPEERDRRLTEMADALDTPEYKNALEDWKATVSQKNFNVKEAEEKFQRLVKYYTM